MHMYISVHLYPVLSAVGLCITVLVLLNRDIKGIELHSCSAMLLCAWVGGGATEDRGRQVVSKDVHTMQLTDQYFQHGPYHFR